MISTATYARKPFEVEASEVTAENMDVIAKWCGGEVRVSDSGFKFIKVHVRRALNERQTRAYIGDYVLAAGTGFKVYTAKAFLSSFDKVEADQLELGFSNEN